MKRYKTSAKQRLLNQQSKARKAGKPVYKTLASQRAKVARYRGKLKALGVKKLTPAKPKKINVIEILNSKTFELDKVEHPFKDILDIDYTSNGAGITGIREDTEEVDKMWYNYDKQAFGS